MYPQRLIFYMTTNKKLYKFFINHLQLKYNVDKLRYFYLSHLDFINIKVRESLCAIFATFPMMMK